MFKRFFRISLLILLCVLLVYAPEIISSVDAPYLLSVPQRTLLRIALCTDSLPDSFSSVISAYQKLHPAVHLRIYHVNAEQLHAIPQPYPDVILYAASSAPALPDGFSAVQASQPQLHAALQAQAGSHRAEEFAAYIDEAIAARSGNL